MKDPTSQLRSATRRAKSDVANKLVSMFLHELSRSISQDWPLKVDDEAYERLVREQFSNQCPYCCCDLAKTTCVIEHLDGMNRCRAGLHVAGNVLVACRRCNNEKRRDDSKPTLSLADSGWESFLSHDGTRRRVLSYLSLLEEYLAGRNRTGIAVRPEPAENKVVSELIPRISANSPVCCKVATSAAGETIFRLPGLCREGD